MGVKMKGFWGLTLMAPKEDLEEGDELDAAAAS